MAWGYSCVQTCQRTNPNHIAFCTNRALIHLSKAVPQLARIKAADDTDAAWRDHLNTRDRHDLDDLDPPTGHHLQVGMALAE
jgi:hypothetical protein